jgi:integrase
MLKRHRETAFARGRARPDDFVFVTAKGTPFYYRNVTERGLRSGLGVVRVSRQLGHARPSITLDVYSHEFEQTQHADDVTAKVTAAFGGIIT